jgi:hypothetical protein
MHAVETDTQDIWNIVQDGKTIAVGFTSRAMAETYIYRHEGGEFF